MTLQSEIDDGLHTPNWQDSISTVKRVMGDALRRLDPRAHVEDTRYFNHSFVPDFVVSWPDPVHKDRDIYLRLDDGLEPLTQAVHLLSDRGPVFVGLSGLRPAQGDRADLGRTLTNHGTMAADPAGLETLGDVSASEFGQVMPAAMLRDGQGLIGESVAGQLLTSSDAFFNAAREHRAAAVTASVVSVRPFLRDGEVGRLENFGRVVWEATGGDPSAYPLTTKLSGVDDDGLRFLLEEGPLDDMQFWRAVGGSVSFERILGLGLATAQNLSVFVRSNADRLLSRAVRVKGAQAALTGTDIRWLIEGGGLALRADDFTAYFSPRGSDLVVEPDHGTGLRVGSLRERVQAERVETVTVETGDGRTVTISADDGFDLVGDDILNALETQASNVVTSVGISVGGKALVCDFGLRSASGHTNAQFELSALLDHALPVIWPLSTETRQYLRRLRADLAAVGEAPRLFPI